LQQKADLRIIEAQAELKNEKMNLEANEKKAKEQSAEK